MSVTIVGATLFRTLTIPGRFNSRGNLTKDTPAGRSVSALSVCRATLTG